ncbi:hypothetical protein N7456_012865 [Penicillium angulare]|uniref:Fido domain-containing protein n=1 Tax=Penicillium angulare TaxID=116970 RepID=A0A9W9EKG3_9EURO|nr:hypothetical protein N7456_012865 [Penicillium angulare]
MVTQMIKQIEFDVSQAAVSGLDSIMLAAKYTHIFVVMYPFVDGNGRLCRLILNSMLLKSGCFIVCLGEDSDGKDRHDYIEIALGASTLDS